jgi:hypothetical protein
MQIIHVTRGEKNLILSKKQGVQGVTIVYIYQLMFTPESSLAPKFSIIECSGGQRY